MAQVRYLDLPLGEVDPTAGRTDGTLGRFVALDVPMPVGTQLFVDETAYRVSRVEEGMSLGCWLRAEGAALPIEDVATVPTPVAEVDAIPAPVDPAPTADENKKRRRRPKTTVGR